MYLLLEIPARGFSCVKVRHSGELELLWIIRVYIGAFASACLRFAVPKGAVVLHYTCTMARVIILEMHGAVSIKNDHRKQ